jgi:hypothetical protein
MLLKNPVRLIESESPLLRLLMSCKAVTQDNAPEESGGSPSSQNFTEITNVPITQSHASEESADNLSSQTEIASAPTT